MLYIIQVGHDDASDRYIRNKIKAVEEAGLEAEVVNLDGNCTTEDLEEEIFQYSMREDCRAIMVQLPLPLHVDKDRVLGNIFPSLDIDGLNPKSKYKPLTPCAIMRWLKEQDVNFKGELVTILGRSDLVGKPLANMMIEAGATVAVCNSKTEKCDMRMLVRNSSIIVSAVGKPGVITKEFVADSKYLTVIDVGINKDKNGKLCGDITKDVRECIEYNGGFCTPVPGGVGKWTVRELVLRLKEMERGY